MRRSASRPCCSRRAYRLAPRSELADAHRARAAALRGEGRRLRIPAGMARSRAAVDDAVAPRAPGARAGLGRSRLREAGGSPLARSSTPAWRRAPKAGRSMRRRSTLLVPHLARPYSSRGNATELALLAARGVGHRHAQRGGAIDRGAARRRGRERERWRPHAPPRARAARDRARARRGALSPTRGQRCGARQPGARCHPMRSVHFAHSWVSTMERSSVVCSVSCRA